MIFFDWRVPEGCRQQDDDVARDVFLFVKIHLKVK